ncbi:peptidylglycine alpha-hydroxylating monooxygenase-like [Mya arenaria]|uniref:peptidylglycine alpha-hydroxylating monooxygenase-like n=1 Tax=Mya arenaria TaxID=6604 RepID=UPI0022E5A130|nr:peptidylglycine alpha-hydroxylating monooxygenase-like [Mya arenaria]
MPLVETSSPDQYICYAYPLTTEEDIYVLSSLTEADKSLAHHVTTGVCEEPTFTGTTWDCTKSQGHTCKGDAVNFGLWDEFSNAKDNGAFKLPEGVSLRLGPRTNLKYFLIQVHFMNPVETPRMSAANVTLEFTTNP